MDTTSYNKELIIKAIYSMLNIKTLEKITVDDLCQCANISKSTYHRTIKQKTLQTILIDDLVDCFPNSEEHKEDEFDHNILSFYYEQKDKINKLFETGLEDIMLVVLSRIIDSYVRVNLRGLNDLEEYYYLKLQIGMAYSLLFSLHGRKWKESLNEVESVLNTTMQHVLEKFTH